MSTYPIFTPLLKFPLKKGIPRQAAGRGFTKAPSILEGVGGVIYTLTPSLPTAGRPYPSSKIEEGNKSLCFRGI